MTAPRGVRIWTASEIAADVAEAKRRFRRRRLGEPMDQYLRAFKALSNANSRLLEDLPRFLGDPVDAALVADLIRDKDVAVALRYLAAPPISKDDLETLIEEKLTWTKIRDDPARARRVRDIIAQVIDPRRFPWIGESRKSTKSEVKAAILASTVVAAAQKVQTSRRTDEKRQLEGEVWRHLAEIGFTEVPVRRIGSIARDAPHPGEFAKSCVVGEDEADAVVGLFDHRVLVVECKASNSEINSRKRINKEIGQDAQNWSRRFGVDQIVPAAVIQGVFKPSYLIAA